MFKRIELQQKSSSGGKMAIVFSENSNTWRVGLCGGFSDGANGGTVFVW